jgi:hypothetical protein
MQQSRAVVNCCSVRVEGEIGRFDFPLYEAVDASRRVVCRGVEFFPRGRPRAWHKTEGFREEALCLEVSQRRYRDNTAPLNRYRRQPQGGTPVTTLQDNAQKEGSRLSFLERQSQSVLQAYEFDAQGQASEVAVAQFKAGTDKRLSAKRANQGLTEVCQEMVARGFSPAQIATVQSQAARAVHEDPAHCTNVAIDDVEVKQQKAQRERLLGYGLVNDARQYLATIPAEDRKDTAAIVQAGLFGLS